MTHWVASKTSKSLSVELLQIKLFSQRKNNKTKSYHHTTQPKLNKTRGEERTFPSGAMITYVTLYMKGCRCFQQTVYSSWWRIFQSLLLPCFFTNGTKVEPWRVEVFTQENESWLKLCSSLIDKLTMTTMRSCTWIEELSVLS